MPVFALFDVGQDRVQAFLMYILSIVGGGVGGYFGAMALGKLTDRLLLGKGKQSPPTLHRFFRWLSGLGVAILVAIFFFPGGGGGKGTGEGNQEGQNKPGSTGTGGPDPKTSIVANPPPVNPGQILEPDEAARALIRLEILGGADLKAKTDFYREVGKDAQLTLEGEKNSVEDLVTQRRKNLKPGVGITIFYRLTENANSTDYQGLTILKTWGAKNGVGVEPTGR